MKKMMMRFLLAMLLCLLLLPAQVFAADTVTVYLDPLGGNDSADGLTEAAAVQTYDAAYAKVKAANGGTIVLLSDLEINEDKRLPSSASNIPVVLTSKTGNEGVVGTTNIRFNAVTTLENITVKLAKASSTLAIFAEGKKLTIGENVNSVGTDGYYFSLAGGKRWVSCSSSELVVTSGTWRNIYPSVYGYKSSSVVAGVTGTAKLTMTGGTLTGFIAPSYTSSAVTGNVEINLSNMSVGTIYCAPVSNGTVTGNVTVTLGEGVVITGSVYSGGNGSGSVNGNVNIILDGADTSDCTRLSGSGTSDFTGTVGSATLTLKTGVAAAQIKAFDTVAVDIPENKSLTIQDVAVTANTVQAKGTLAFSGPGSLTAQTVSGTVNCSILDSKLYNHTYITAPAGSSFVFDGQSVPENNGVWKDENLEQFQGLILTADSGISVTLYTGLDSTDHTEVTPYYTEGNTQYYPNLIGKYHYIASGTGCYTVKKNIYMSREESATKLLLDVTPTKMANVGGWEASKVFLLTDEMLQKVLPSDKALWPAYADVFTTPGFGEDRAEHLTTTQQEMEAFIVKLDDADDDMYIYSVGASAHYQHDIPLVLFTTTDLSGAKTLEEAAELVKGNGKPTIHYRAHMHGNEPAGGEAALAMIQRLDGAYGKSVLESINIYVIPRLNPDGTQDYERTLHSGIDANRDLLRLRSLEMQNHHKVFLLFEPEVVLDGHEYNVGHNLTSIYQADMLTAAGFGAQSNDSFKDMSVEILQTIFAAEEAQGLTGYYYNKEVNGDDPNISRGYMGSQGTLFFLMESRGISAGKSGYERRVMAHVVAATTIIDYVAAAPEQVQKVVDDEKERIVKSGLTYEEEDLVILDVGDSTEKIPGYTYDAATGEKKETLLDAITHDVIKRSRPAPTAYVIPAGESFTQKVLDLMDKQGIAYTQLPEGAVVQLQQYTGSATEAALTPEMTVTFPNGAYVFCMNQVRGTILSVLMEPDVTDAASYKGTLAQQGILTATDDVFPLYRYIHDLNEDGSIDYLAAGQAPDTLTVENASASGQTGAILGLDEAKLYEYRAEGDESYTAVAAGSTRIEGLKIGRYYVRYQAQGDAPASKDAICVVILDGLTEYVVYLNPQNGNDSNDGLAENAAVKSVARAYSQASVLMDAAPAGSVAKIVLLSDLISTSATLTFPEHTFPVLLTSKTGAEEITHDLSSTSTGRKIVFNGPTTLDNITLHQTSKSIGNYISANGHSLTIGRNVTSLPTGSYYFNLVGGGIENDCTSANMTVLSGTWRNIYAAGYKGSVDGDVSLVMDNCKVTAIVQISYNAGITGNVTMELSNVTADTLFCGNSYAGNMQGNVTLTLGEGIQIEEIYAGTRDKGDVTETVTMIVDGADLTNVKLVGKAQNDTGIVGKSVLVYKSGKLGVYSDFDEFLDESSQVVRGDMNNDGTVSDADAMYLLRYTLFGDTRYPLH